MPKLERKRKAAAEGRATANAARAKLEVDVTDLEEQLEKHAQTQAGGPIFPVLNMSSPCGPLSRSTAAGKLSQSKVGSYVLRA